MSTPTPAPAPLLDRESLSKTLGLAESVTNLAYKLAIATGACVTLAYLFSIKFFPAGMTPGDVVFFVFVALASGFLYCALLLYGAISSLWLIRLLQFIGDYFRKPGSTVIPYRLPAMLAGNEYLWASLFACFVGVVIGVVSWNIDSTMLLLTFFTAGFLTLVLFTVGRHPAAGSAVPQIPFLRRVVIAISVPIMVVLIIGPSMSLVHMVFEGLGIRSQGISIEIPESELGEIERTAEVIRRPILDCRRVGGGRLLVHNADVLWTSVGGTSLVSFSGHPHTERSGKGAAAVVLLRLDSSSTRIIKARPQLDPCFDLSNDMLFETGNEKVTTAAEASVRVIADAILASGKSSRVVVRGHSDARPFTHIAAGKDIDNQKLSELRADEVAMLLKRWLKKPGIVVAAEGAGRREPKVQCVEAPGMTQYERERCHAPNRRVEIRVTYSREAPVKTAQGSI